MERFSGRLHQGCLHRSRRLSSFTMASAAGVPEGAWYRVRPDYGHGEHSIYIRLRTTHICGENHFEPGVDLGNDDTMSGVEI